MGCTGSRHALRGGVKGGGGRSYRRSASGPAAVHHHTVALRSSTLGSLSLDRDEEMIKWRAAADGGRGAAAAKATPLPLPLPPPPAPQQQPARRQRQVIGTPTKTPVREPEVINVWELMAGLDDKEQRDGAEEHEDDRHRERSQSQPGSPDFDPEIISAFRKALGEEVSPPRDKGEDDECVIIRKREIQRFPGIVRARVSAFQQRIDAKLAKMARATPVPAPAPAPPEPQQLLPPPPPDSQRKVVLYLTSLRGIRKTFEDCWAAKCILQGYGVRVDERDLSLHGGFKDELHASLGAKAGRLPQVFVDGKHLGGADDIRRLHEAGELSRALECCDTSPSVGVAGCGGGKGGVALEACSGCGGVRFVPCEECSGSCKVFLEELDSFRRCPECNENGLVRCPLCCL
ncbi:uncharacterized protein At3g28850 [Brachypodium distachyon]|uniref:Glutaredoxin domain-containing protein n=1 Tax=Brachypodium distachyon TaxID=15368 RepID=I1IF97_BRADI|nr:uncharacterized protein At3g28850 [Brachypodium distachyon]KQK01926.1 hypothetical protein BRADI_3g59260v3 [Brachypodium distachyon]|eukprot:XP_003570646.1 uncharacterized protein At3g28850 [Brachypodium distachyon]